MWLRWVSCEAAQTARRSPQFAAAFQAIAKRRENRMATTAAARRLLTRARRRLTGAERAPRVSTRAASSRCGALDTSNDASSYLGRNPNFEHAVVAGSTGAGGAGAAAAAGAPRSGTG